MKTVLITGASSGIGKAAVQLFAAKGWNIIAGMRHPEDTEEKADKIAAVRIDVSQPETIAPAIEAGLQRFGSINVLVNCAGYGLAGAFEDAEMAQVRQQYEVNVFGLMAVTQAVLPHLRAQGSGCIVNISSFGGIMALPFATFYASSKFAVEGFSEALSHELVPLNIRVKIVEPGSIDTNFLKNLDRVRGNTPAYAPLVQAFFPRYQKFAAHLRKNTAGEVAQTIYQACTDDTGQLRYVPGDDAQFFIDLKQKNGETAFIRQVRQAFYEA